MLDALGTPMAELARPAAAATAPAQSACGVQVNQNVRQPTEE